MKSGFKLYGLLLVALVMLAGCATRNVPASYSLNPEGSNGLVVGSITYKGSYSGYGVYYRELSSNKWRLLEAGQGTMLIPIPDKSDFPDGIKGKLVVAELPPGDYEIFDWRVSSGPATVKPANQFSIRFKVEPGKAVYVGNFDFLQTSRLGLTVTGAELTYRGQLERDYALLKVKYPKLADVPLALATSSDTLIQRLGGVDGVRFDIFVPR